MTLPERMSEDESPRIVKPELSVALAGFGHARRDADTRIDIDAFHDICKTLQMAEATQECQTAEQILLKLM